MFMHPPLRAVFIVLLALGVLAGLAACSKRKAQETVVASFEAPAEGLTRMVQMATKGSTSLGEWTPGPFEMKPEGGAHVVRWTIVGQVARAGTVEGRVMADLSETERNNSRPVGCRFQKPDAAPGPATYSCDSARVRTEMPKKFYLVPAIQSLDGFIPTRMQIEVLTVPVETSAWDWFISMPLLGLVMVGLWWFLFRR